MKTKLNKKSLAAVLAAIILSSGTFLSVSLSLSPKAEAQYMLPNCITTENGVPVRKCNLYDKYECNVSVSGTDLDGKPVTIEFLCLGQPIEDSGNDERNDDFVTIKP